jgi:3-hydroxybutyrate dehydrogenase
MDCQNMRLDGQVAIITGGSSGIGNGIADVFAAAGANIVIISRTRAEQAAQEISDRHGNKTLGLNLDITKEDRVIKGVNTVYEKFGRVDVLINNAGFQIVSPIDEMEYDQWKSLIAVQVDGSFLMSKECMKIMKKQKNGGKIIMTGSVHSFFVSANKGPYCTAKHALLGLTRSIATEGGPFNISANLIGPGFVMTDLIKNQIPDRARVENITEEEIMASMVDCTVDKKFTKIEEIARLALFFASTQGNAYTGQSMMVSHGWGMS